MSDANQQQEPSMEEILASIRRIISEDDVPEGEQAESEEAAAEEAPAEAATEEAADDVLELTEVAEEPEAVSEDVPAEEPAEEELSIDEVLEEQDQPDELELRETEEETPAEPEPEPEPAPAPAPAPPVAQSPDAGLLATEAAAAAAGSLSGLVAAVDRAHGGSILGDGNRTIEDLVKEVMRPMVKDWLDENLPGLTERLVRREIERLARLADED